MNRADAEQHALHICRTMGVDDETALLGGLPAYLETLVKAEVEKAAGRLLDGRTWDEYPEGWKARK